LSGDPGLGKTWFLDRIAEHAEARAATVLRGGALEAEGMPPYRPFLEALGAYVRRSPRDVLQAQLGAGARLVAGILPEIELKLARVPHGLNLAPEQARLRLFDAVANFVRGIASSRPAVLLLDDLQWVDTATLELLMHVARRNRSAGLLLVGAYRPGDAADNPALQRALAELGRQRLLAATLDLPPLSEQETRALGEAHLGGTLRAELASDVWEHSEGNPFVAEELLRGWLEAAQLRSRRPRASATTRPPVWPSNSRRSGRLLDSGRVGVPLRPQHRHPTRAPVRAAGGRPGNGRLRLPGRGRPVPGRGQFGQPGDR
jgi:hypothetical protein